MALYNFMGIKGFWIFGVFDGHGTNGAKVSNFVKDIIPEHIKS
jgi:serine/threonine protein phosphatase PrpC